MSEALFVHSGVLRNIQTPPRPLAGLFRNFHGVTDHAGECEHPHISTKSPPNSAPQSSNQIHM